MALQIGDVIKFAELAWKAYDYGWSSASNASQQYYQFGREVHYLAESLDSLSGVINSVKDRFHSHGMLPRADLKWDQDSLSEIIGDYDATLNECMRLLDDNQSYAAATGGPVKNIGWHVMVEPSVAKLRSRILLHNTKIQHVLRPFEMDLHLRIHRDLVDHIQGAHAEILGTRRELQALIRVFNPSLAQELGLQLEPEINEEVSIPDFIRQQLERNFDLHPDRKLNEDGCYPPLCDIANAFVNSFELSTRLFEPESGIKEPPADQYLALLTSQFLMAKMLDSPEFQDPPRLSHWPSYVSSLQKDLSKECHRFNRLMATPAIPSIRSGLPALAIWIKEDVPPYIESVTLPLMMDHLLELPLEANTPTRWRRIKVLRYCDGTDRRFRIVITAGEAGQPASETCPIDFDVSTACLYPRYANHSGTEPLEMALWRGGTMHPLVFRSRSDAYRFQQALTGYEVVDHYMEYRSQVIFVIGSGQIIKENASVQLWRPIRLDGERLVNDSEMEHLSYGGDPGWRQNTPSSKIAQRLSPAPLDPGSGDRNSRTWSTRAAQSSDNADRDRQYSPLEVGAQSPPRQTGSTIMQHTTRAAPRQPNSTPVPAEEDNALTGTDTAGAPSDSSSSASIALGQSYSPRRVSVGGLTNLSGTGTLHCKPTEPLLVLFTQNCETHLHNIIAIALDPRTEVNYRRCHYCASSASCCHATLERGTSGGKLLCALSLGDPTIIPDSALMPRWNILPLSQPLRGRRMSLPANDAWRKVVRVSICFEQMEQRRELVGQPCRCNVTTEGLLMTCLGHWHRGRLGMVKEWYRRVLGEWHRKRYPNQAAVVESQRRQSVSRFT